MIATLLAWIVAPPLMVVSRGEVDLTPPEALPLGGYTARGGKLAEPGGESLKARSLVFELKSSRPPEPGRLALVSVEMLTIPESLVREVRARLKQPALLMLVATHTHCAPDSQMLNDRMNFAIPGISSFREKWLSWYADRIADSVNSAKPWETFTEILTQERRLDANRGRRKFAEPDTTATQIVGKRADGETRNLALNYAAHATVYGSDELRTHPDWPILVASKGLFLPGAIGDVSPRADGPTAREKMDDMRKRLNARVPFLESQVWTSRQFSYAAHHEAIHLNAPVHHPAFATENKIPDGLASTLVKKFAPAEAAITAFRMGKLAVVGVPGEPTSELGRQIRDAGKRLGFSSVLVVSHTNGWMGYILDAEDYDRGGYEATLSFYGKNEGAEVVNAAVRSLRRLVK